MIEIVKDFQLSMLALPQAGFPFREVVFERDLIVSRALQDEHGPLLASTGLDGGEVGKITPVRCAEVEGQFGGWSGWAEVWTSAELALLLEVFDLRDFVDVNGFVGIEMDLP